MNAMVWDPWNPTPVTRGRPLKVRSDREPILMGPLPRVCVTSPDDPNTVRTAAVPTQETTPGTTTTTTTYPAERTRIRLPETDAEGAPLVQKTRTTSSAPATTAEMTSRTTTTSSARALIERVGNEAGED